MEFWVTLAYRFTTGATSGKLGSMYLVALRLRVI